MRHGWSLGAVSQGFKHATCRRCSCKRSVGPLSSKHPLVTYHTQDGKVFEQFAPPCDNTQEATNGNRK